MFEKEMGQPFNRFLCCLHLNELPLRHLVTYYLGETSGPNSFKSALGKQVVDLKKPTIAEFPAIPNDDFPILPEETVKSLSRDQNMLYRASRAVINGFCPSSLGSAALSGVSHRFQGNENDFIFRCVLSYYNNAIFCSVFLSQPLADLGDPHPVLVHDLQSCTISHPTSGQLHRQGVRTAVVSLSSSVESERSRQSLFRRTTRDVQTST